jgi:hypothetical protein
MVSWTLFDYDLKLFELSSKSSSTPNSKVSSQIELLGTTLLQILRGS